MNVDYCIQSWKKAYTCDLRSIWCYDNHFRPFQYDAIVITAASANHVMPIHNRKECCGADNAYR